MQIHFLYCEDCPSHDVALARLREVLQAEAVDVSIDIVTVETDAQAAALRFIGSPTILIDGQDIDPPASDEPYARTCRIYRQENGRISPLPSVATIRAAVRAHLQSEHMSA
ncbi:MAG: DUF2703 domain-containing protein [Chloroflexaceae bacterium]|nr:DUF2703 domain-containing protein [Chloroflexaceae bacterium]NJL33320.1 DUF2703 domain-containing protein [Chloroflexaceae bacterium]